MGVDGIRIIKQQHNNYSSNFRCKPCKQKVSKLSKVNEIITRDGEDKIAVGGVVVGVEWSGEE